MWCQDCSSNFDILLVILQANMSRASFLLLVPCGFVGRPDGNQRAGLRDFPLVARRLKLSC